MIETKKSVHDKVLCESNSERRLADYLEKRTAVQPYAAPMEFEGAGAANEGGRAESNVSLGGDENSARCIRASE